MNIDTSYIDIFNVFIFDILISAILILYDNFMFEKQMISLLRFVPQFCLRYICNFRNENKYSSCYKDYNIH